jgi:hypothetical protein
MIDDAQTNWLLIEGLLPLFGASVVFLLLGVGKKLTTPGRPYAWKEAVDSLGWLYGALIIAIQAWSRCVMDADKPQYALGAACVLCAILCGTLLFAAMLERGSTPGWAPQAMFKFASVVLVVGVLCAGYRAQAIPKKASTPTAALPSSSGASTNRSMRQSTGPADI